MFDIGFAELLLCAIVALLVLGPERLPGAARTVGRWVGRARRTVNHFTEQIDREIRAEELRKRLEEEMRELKGSGYEDLSRQVTDALKAPLPLSSGTPDAAPPAATSEAAPPGESTDTRADPDPARPPAAGDKSP